MTGQLVEKLDYLTRQTRRRLFSTGGGCPNCGNESFIKLDGKALVTELRECRHCKLCYRFPTDSVAENRTFYQKAYKQGFTTDLPNDALLAHLKATSFAGHEKSYAVLIDLLKKLGAVPGNRVFDYGCSWGFGSWQFANAGFTVRALEISEPRAAFAREKLGVDCINSIDLVERDQGFRASFDVFFSNHVMEHVPSPAKAIALAKHLVKPGGLFVAVTPNGSQEFRKASPRSWHQFWGKVHLNLISDTFWAAAFHEHDYFVGALPSCITSVEAWAKNGGQTLVARNEPELLCVSRL